MRIRSKMPLEPRRRDVIAAAAALSFSSRSAAGAPATLGIPGPYRGRVISVHHESCFASGEYQAGPVRQMMRQGMTALTGAPDWVEAWRVFAQPGDVVGIKVNPVGSPHVISSPVVLHEIIAGLEQAGVKRRDIVVYDRYRREFMNAGFHKWLPEGVGFAWAVEQYDRVQLDMRGYDENHYMEVPIVQPGQNPSDPHNRRSYVARFLTERVNKVVCLPVLKHHDSAGVTLALKNVAYGMVNNVERSHQTASLNVCSVFIPAIVEIPVIRQKAVLHILDGVKGVCRGGPAARPQYVFEHKTIYFGTDPVALDRIAGKAVDAERVARGMPPVLMAKKDPDGRFLNGQAEHIEIAGALGLGEFDERKIDLKHYDLTGA